MLLYVLSVLGLLPNFQKTKCKRLLNSTMERIKLLEKRHQVRLRQLHQDVMELLRRGKEHSIQPCVVRIWKEQCLFLVYTKITDYCQCVQHNLKDIAELRECPFGLEEPLAGLCFAASCCADLPELQELRDIFAMKYGKQVVSPGMQPSCHVDQEFLELLCASDLSEAQKQALLQEITTQYMLKQVHDAEATEQPESVDSVSKEGMEDVKECNRPEFMEAPCKFSEIQGQKVQGAAMAVQESTCIDAVGNEEDMGSTDVTDEHANRKRSLEDRERHGLAFKKAFGRKFCLHRGMEEDKDGGKEGEKPADKDKPPPPKRAPPPLPILLSDPTMRRSHKDIQVPPNTGILHRCSMVANSSYLENYGSHVHPRLPKYEDLVANFGTRKH